MIYIAQLSPVYCPQAALSLQPTVSELRKGLRTPGGDCSSGTKVAIKRRHYLSVEACFFLIALTIRAIKLLLLQDGYNCIFYVYDCITVEGLVLTPGIAKSA